LLGNFLAKPTPKKMAREFSHDQDLKRTSLGPWQIVARIKITVAIPEANRPVNSARYRFPFLCRRVHSVVKLRK
jgi:hypothetical protein